MRLGRLGFSVLCGWLLVGCGGGESKENPEALTFVWIPKELNNAVFETGRDGALLKAAELTQREERKVEVTYAGPETGDASGQADIVYEAIENKVDGIGISCNADPTNVLRDAIDAAATADIPVMTWDSDASDSARFTYLGVSNYDGGVMAAKILAASMATAANKRVAILVGGNAANIEARVQGFIDEMTENHPEFSIAPTVACLEGDQGVDAIAKIEQTMADQAVDGTPIGGWFWAGLWPMFNLAVDDPTNTAPLWGAGALDGSVKTVCFDTLPFQLPFVEEGLVQGLVGQKYWGWGYDTIQMLYDKVTKGAQFSPFTDSGMDIVCDNNVAEMKAMWTSSDFTQTLTACDLL